MKSKLSQGLFHLNLNQLISFTILLLDIVAFSFDFFANFDFVYFTNFDRFVFYGLFFCLFFDCFLWGKKQFLGLQIVKLLVLFMNSHFQMSILITIYFWSFAFYFYNINYTQQKKDKTIFFISNFFVAVLFILYYYSYYYSKNPLLTFIVLSENFFICFPLRCIRVLFSSNESNPYPKNTFEFHLQNFNEIPITAFSWILPFCLESILELKETMFYILVMFLALFTLFVEIVNYYKIYYRVNIQIYLWTILKFGIIALLIITGVKSGLIGF